MSDENPFTGEIKDASPEVLFDACILSQQVLREKLKDLVLLHRGMWHYHEEARRRGMKFPDLLTDAERAALGFVTQNPLQN